MMEEHLKNLLLSYKRKIMNKPYLLFSKRDEERLSDLAKVIKDLKAIPEDFISFGIRYYSSARVFPSVSHLLSEKFLLKFRYHQALKNRYRYEKFETNEDSVTIFDTLEIVSYRDFALSPDKDPRIQFINFCIKNGKEISQNDRSYALAKFEFFKLPVPLELTHESS